MGQGLWRAGDGEGLLTYRARRRRFARSEAPAQRWGGGGGIAGPEASALSSRMTLTENT